MFLGSAMPKNDQRTAEQPKFIPDKPEASRKPYRAPALRMLDADTAKALETTAVPGDVGAIATLNSIRNSKTKRGGTSTGSTLHALEKPIR